MLIDLNTVSLSDYIIEKLNRSNLKETENLFNEIRGLEYLFRTKILNKYKMQ